MQQWSKRFVAPAGKEIRKAHTHMQWIPSMARALARGVLRPGVVAPNDHFSATQLLLEGTDACMQRRKQSTQKGLHTSQNTTRLVQWTGSRAP